MDRSFSKLGEAVGLAGMTLLLSTLWLLVGAVLIQYLGLSTNNSKLAVMIWTPLCLVALAITLQRALRSERLAWSSPPRAADSVLFAFILGIFAAPAIGWLTNLIRVAVEGNNLNPQIDLVLLDGQPPLQTTLTAILIILAIPIAEEILYRGCLIDLLRRKVDVRTSMVISSIAFGIAHFDVANSIGTGLLGFVLAWLRFSTNSLYPSIAMHAGFNLVGYSVILLSTT